MNDRFGLYSKPERFILVFGGMFGILLAGWIGLDDWRADVLNARRIGTLLLTAIIAGGAWGYLMWLWTNKVMMPRIQRKKTPRQ